MWLVLLLTPGWGLALCVMLTLVIYQHAGMGLGEWSVRAVLTTWYVAWSFIMSRKKMDKKAQVMTEYALS